MARNLKDLVDEDDTSDSFEKLSRKPKYSKKSKEVEIRRQRQARERARQSSIRQQQEDYFEEE